MSMVSVFARRIRRTDGSWLSGFFLNGREEIFTRSGVPRRCAWEKSDTAAGPLADDGTFQMKHPLVPALTVCAFLVVLTACDRQVVVVEKAPATPIPEPVAQTKTLETSRLGAAVDAYVRNPSPDHGAAVKTALAKLDGEIAELEEYVTRHDGNARAEASAKLKNLQSYRAAETLRFTAAQAKGAVGVREPADARSGADKVEDSARKVGGSIENAARKTGDAIKDAVR